MITVFTTIITMLGCIQAEVQQHEQGENQDLYNDLDIINSNPKAGDFAYKKLMSIQDKLEKALNSKTKELIESTDGLLRIILELMYTEYPYFSRRDYKNQLLNDVAEILVCNVKTPENNISSGMKGHYYRLKGVFNQSKKFELLFLKNVMKRKQIE